MVFIFASVAERRLSNQQLPGSDELSPEMPDEHSIPKRTACSLSTLAETRSYQARGGFLFLGIVHPLKGTTKCKE
ncbi:MAG: hypothetical protein ABIQ09_04425 [Jatrophihabitantaceae bacterium]